MFHKRHNSENFIITNFVILITLGLQRVTFLIPLQKLIIKSYISHKKSEVS